MRIMNYIDFNNAETIMDILHTYLDYPMDTNYNISYKMLEIIINDYISIKNNIQEFINSNYLNEELLNEIEVSLIHSDDYYNEILALYNKDEFNLYYYEQPIRNMILILSNVYMRLYEYGFKEILEVDWDK